MDIKHDEMYEIAQLSDLLNEYLSGANQENSFRARGIENDKFVVEFNICRVPEDDYVGFAGY